MRSSKKIRRNTYLFLWALLENVRSQFREQKKMLVGIFIGFAGAYALSGVLMAIILSLNLINNPTLETVDNETS